MMPDEKVARNKMAKDFNEKSRDLRRISALQQHKTTTGQQHNTQRRCWRTFWHHGRSLLGSRTRIGIIENNK